jgi:uncharacterized protein with PIN domain
MTSTQAPLPPEEPVRCDKCDRRLEVAKVNVGYMGDMFKVDMLKCPQCGQVYVPEDLALGKMVEVEKQLEDK